MRHDRNFIFIYAMFSCIFIVGYNYFTPLTSSSMSHQIVNMGAQEFVFIFLNNLLYTLLGFMLSCVGLSIIFIIKIPIIIAMGPASAGISPIVYYFSSFTHGFCEMLIGCILLSYTISHVSLYVKYVTGRATKIHLLYFYKRTLQYVIPTVILFLLISAFLEVYISNFLIQILL
ncbi:hypothetical protein BBG47_00430 [Paenibacillus sp. KS1]|nr:hypothetical protein BBG47_00430 [Paenibacillus sp. KS1]